MEPISRASSHVPVETKKPSKFVHLGSSGLRVQGLGV